VELCWATNETTDPICFALPTTEADVEANYSPIPFLRALNFTRIHIHHVHGYPQTVLKLPEWLQLPYDCTLHDYYPACPHYSFVAATGQYCGEPDTAGCSSCLSQRPAQWGCSIDAWRERFAAFLNDAQRVFVASADMAARLERYFPSIHPILLAHPESPPASPRSWCKVLILGGLSPAKGLRVVQACAEDAQARDLPLFFRVLGYTSERISQWPLLPLSIFGEYRDEDLADLIALERADVIFIPSQVPESYSYVLSAAVYSRLPIVAAELGALTERLRKYSRKALLPWNTEPAVWNDQLLSCLRPTAELSTLEAPTPVSPEQYLAVYRQGLTISPVAPVSEIALPKIPPAHKASPDAPLGFADLFEFGVDCGHAEAAAELRRRLTELDKLLVFLTHERVTRPLRWCVLTLRRWQRTGRRLVYGTQQLPRRLAIAGNILRSEGGGAVVARVRNKLRRDRLTAVQQPLSTYQLAATIQPLQLQTTDAPEYSIVIPVYGQHLHTFSCLESIAKHTSPGTYEVLIVDDCSAQPAATVLAAVRGPRWVRNTENCGFLRTANRGVSLARAGYVVLLNNDTLVTAGWLKALREVLDHQPDAAVVGAKLVYPDGTLQEAGGIIWRDGTGWNYGRGDDASDPRYNYVRSVDYCSAACWLFQREFFASMHGFEEAYAPAYYEDTDFAFRVRAAGKRVYYQPAATIVHFEGASCGRDESAGIKQHQAVNRKNFRRRWNQVLSTHRPNGIAPELEKDRSCRYRVLVIDACMLAPDEDSGSFRMLAIFRELKALGAKVTFVAHNLEYREPYVQALQQHGIEVLYSPYFRSVEEYLEQYGKFLSLVMISRHYVAAPYVESIRRYSPKALFVFDSVDLHYLREERLAALKQSTSLRATAAWTRKQELSVVTKADVTLVVSPIEQKILQAEVPQANVQVLSNIHEVTGSTTPFAERHDILFVGGFRHPPNADAILWYCDAIWPLVHENLPEVRTLIVGSEMPQSVFDMAGNGIEVLGHVPEIEPVLARVRVSIAPLRYGAGVKGKVNLSMSYGVPVVATPAATEGAYLVAGENVLVAETAAEFATALVNVYRDAALWNKLSTNGVANIQQHFSPDVARTTLQQLLSVHRQQVHATQH
jgi:GT2 family glycosyltransferase